MSEFWIVATGLGMAFHGLLILWVGGLLKKEHRKRSDCSGWTSTVTSGACLPLRG